MTHDNKVILLVTHYQIFLTIVLIGISDTYESLLVTK